MSLISYSQSIPTFEGAISQLNNNIVPLDTRLKTSSDINNDGNLDLVGVRSNYVSVIYTDGAGTFIGDTSYLISINTVWDCDTADLNHDGFEDIVGVSNGSWGPQHEVFILMSDSLGVFNLSFTTSVGNVDLNDLTLNDFDNDGYTDLALATDDAANIPVLYGNASYNFQPFILVSTGITSIGYIYYISSADFTNDGCDDIVISTSWLNKYSVLISDSAQGLFTPNVYSTNGPVYDVVAADYNMDGFNDLALVYHNFALEGVEIIMGIGTGGFPLSQGTFFPVPTSASPVYLLWSPDINSDGIPDIVAVESGSSAGHFFINNGFFPFALTPTEYAVCGFNPVFADFNEDGNTDIYGNTPPGNTSYGYCYAWGDGSGSFPIAPRVGDNAIENRYVDDADFNNDGYGDVLVFDQTSYRLDVLLGNASGDLVPTWTSAATYGENFAIGDYNNDNILDLATCRSINDYVKIFNGDGAGGFLAPDSMAVPNSTDAWITKGDLNVDGNLDLIFAWSTSGNCYYCTLLNNGTGGFLPPQLDTVTISPGFASIEVGLMNSDNIPDLVISHFNNKVSVHMGIGNATFAPPVLYNTVHSSFYQIVLTHMDYDAYPDICLFNGTYIDVLYGTSIATFPACSSYYAGGVNVAIADLNGDWLTDFAYARTGKAYVNIGDGNRNFVLSDTAYCLNHDPSGLLDICAPDVNNDGLRDLVDNRLTLLRNTSPPPIITSVPSPASENNAVVSIYPNPANENSMLQINSLNEEDADVQIYSASGELVNQFFVPLSAGDNGVPLNVSTYQPGLYIVQVRRGDVVQCKSMVVQ